MYCATASAPSSPMLLVSITRVSRVSLFFKASSIWVMLICPMPFFPKSAAMHLHIERQAGFRIELVGMRLVATVVQKQVVSTQERGTSAIVMTCLLA